MSVQKNTFHITTLGCAKNLVDSSVLEQLLKKRGLRPVSSSEKAEYVLINTCGFIHDAREESLEAINSSLRDRHKNQQIFVTGCLSQRLQSKLFELSPGISGMIGTRNLTDINQLIERPHPYDNNVDLTSFIDSDPISFLDNVNYSVIQGASSYLKIADGCHRKCAFCAIPLIKGSLMSRPSQEIIADALSLQSKAVKEINLIAQDVTAYGQDLGQKDGLTTLLKELLPQIPHIPWVRLLYTYPGMVSDKLIELFKADNQLLPYLDMPLQHADPTVLKSMGRPSDINWVRKTIKKMKESIPNLVTRTTFIVGYPTETEKSFDTLLDFLDEIQFDHVGVFTYSVEEDTIALPLGDPISQEEKVFRKNKLLELQASISLRNNQKCIGKEMTLLVEGLDKKNRVLVGRTFRDAPEIDGLVIANGLANSGDMVKVKITDATEYDLYAELI